MRKRKWVLAVSVMIAVMAPGAAADETIPPPSSGRHMVDAYEFLDRVINGLCIGAPGSVGLYKTHLEMKASVDGWGVPVVDDYQAYGLFRLVSEDAARELTWYQFVGAVGVDRSQDKCNGILVSGMIDLTEAPDLPPGVIG